jgi:hypothetical protein
MSGGARARLRPSPSFLDRWIDRILALAADVTPAGASRERFVYDRSVVED